MNRCPFGAKKSFHLVNLQATVQGYLDYHMDLKDCLAVTFGLIGEVVYKGCQGNVHAAKENKNGFYRER